MSYLWCISLACCLGSMSATDIEFVIGGLRVAEGADRDIPTSLKTPFGVDIDADGQMWIVELAGGRVWLKKRDGQLVQIAGAGEKGYQGDGGDAESARFNGMHNVAVSRQGDVFIADSWNHCIRRIDAGQRTISTWAGTGQAGFAGDGQSAQQARFDFLMCVTLSADEQTLYVADLRNRRIRAIDVATQRIRTVAGNGKKGIPKDGQLATEAPLVDPRAVASDAQGNVYVLERSGHALRVVSPEGRISTVVGTGQAGDRDGPGRQAQLKSPKHLAIDLQGRVYIADEGNALIRCYDPATQQVTTLLGGGTGTPPIILRTPHGVCVHQGKLLIVDTGHGRILSMDLPPAATQ